MWVREVDCAENVAFNKFVTFHDIFSGSGNNPVDGNPGTEYHCKGGARPHWWKVDLGSKKMIDQMHMMAITRGSGHYEVTVSNISDFGIKQFCFSSGGANQAMNEWSFDCTGNKIVAQHLKVNLSGRMGMRLWELTVMGWDI